MNFLIRRALVFLLLLVPGLVFAYTGIPDPGNSEAWLGYEGPEIPTLLVVPDGTGSPFTEAQLPDGTRVDCTVYLRMLDSLNYPIANFPFEDLWLESADGGLVACTGGTNADQNTDMMGLTSWVQPLNAGGYSADLLHVMVNGENVQNPGLPLHFNSPDINGNLMVDLVDISQFSSDFFGAYHFRSDLYRNGVIDLVDVMLLARGMGAECP